MKTIQTILIVVVILFILYKIYRRFIKMDISKKGRDFIRGIETGGKFYNTKIPDMDGYSIGVGHYIGPNEKFEGVDLMTGTLTNAQVDRLFHQDLKRFVDAANNAITAPMSQHEFDAIVSVLFNVGKGWGDGIGEDATFIKLINETGTITGRGIKSKQDIAETIMRFNKPSKIIGRRAKEARLFAENNYNWQDNENISSIARYVNMA